jgi:hypothetical protein
MSVSLPITVGAERGPCECGILLSMKSSCPAWILCLALAAPFGWTQAGSSPSTQEAKLDQVSANAWQLFLLANQARAAAGVAPLQWDPALAETAKKHCERMSLEGEISHRSSNESMLEQRADDGDAHFSLIKENVALASDPDGIHEMWMDTPWSRDNLLDPDFDRAGVAVVALHEMLYAVAVYSHTMKAPARAKVLTREQVEDTVAGLLRAYGLSIALDKSDARNICAGRTMANVAPSFVEIWQNWDMSKLPDVLKQLLPQAHYLKASVGSCPAKDVDGALRQYRVAALFYSSGTGVY